MKKEKTLEQETKNSEEELGGNPELEEEKKEASADTGEQSTSEEESLQGEIELLKKQLDECKDKELRSRAEFENFRKRTDKEKIQSRENAIAESACEFLLVLDNLERALDSETEDEKFKSGIEMIVNQFKDVLKKLGIEEMDAMGKEFDPQLHNAVTQVEDENFAENSVCNVLQKGYIMGDRVIRHAMVVVANP